MNKAERTLAAAEAVRRAYRDEKRLARLESKRKAGRPIPVEFAEKLAGRLAGGERS